MVNAQALNETLAAIEASPSRHDQGVWAEDYGCGTVGCIAGWRAILDGYTEFRNGLDYVDGALANPVTDALLPVADDNARAWSESGQTTIASYAAERFGLDQDQAEVLFCESNSLDDIRDIIREFTAD